MNDKYIYIIILKIKRTSGYNISKKGIQEVLRTSTSMKRDTRGSKNKDPQKT
jgi:hypothetical protein